MFVVLTWRVTSHQYWLHTQSGVNCFILDFELSKFESHRAAHAQLGYTLHAAHAIRCTLHWCEVFVRISRLFYTLVHKCTL